MSAPDNLTFEQSLAELDKVVRDLEDSQLGLEESLARYEQGVGLIKRCYGRLREAEQRVLLLTGVDEEGQPVLQPFQPATESKPETRRTRKKTDESRPGAY
jgi:exodeoxyribonuclease VII small subunit